MTTTHFIDGSTHVPASWLNDADAHVYDQVAGAHSAANLSFDPAGTGAVQTTVQAKLRESVSVLDFGVDPTGVIDSTTALRAAVTAAAGKMLLIIGTPLISDTITFDKPIKVVFDGASRSTDAYQNSYLIKKDGLNFPGIVVTCADFIGVGGGVQKQTGFGPAAGYGVHILGTNCTWYNLSVFDMGSTGIRIGSDTTANNTNGFCLVRPTSTSNGGHGIHIADNSGSLDTNAGTVITPQCQGNALDGMYLENASLTTIMGPLLEQNQRWGLNFASTATQNTVVGGDVEANNQSAVVGVKDIWIQATAGAGTWGQTIINTVVSAGGGGPYLVNDDSYSTIIGTQADYLAAPKIDVPSVKTTSVVNTGSIGPEGKPGLAWGGEIAGTTTNALGYVNVAGLGATTLFTASNAAGSSFLVFGTQGVEGYVIVALVSVGEAAASAVVTDLFKTNANLAITASGLDIQATNGIINIRTVKYSVIRFA